MPDRETHKNAKIYTTSICFYSENIKDFSILSN